MELEYQGMIAFIDPKLGKALIEAASWLLIALGLLKVMIYIVGELLPGAYSKIKSEKARKFMTGNGNRLVFGLLGAFTVLLGVAFLSLGRFLFGILERSGNF